MPDASTKQALPMTDKPDDPNHTNPNPFDPRPASPVTSPDPAPLGPTEKQREAAQPVKK